MSADDFTVIYLLRDLGQFSHPNLSLTLTEPQINNYVIKHQPWSVGRFKKCISSGLSFYLYYLDG